MLEQAEKRVQRSSHLNCLDLGCLVPFVYGALLRPVHSQSCFPEIAKEMYRVFRPGACVVNCEMCLDVPPDVFLSGFEDSGFETRDVTEQSVP
jgi:hypothetical protein